MTTKTALAADNLSMEAIAFQDNKFGLALEAVFAEILEKRYSGKELDATFAPRLTKIVKEYTNLQIEPTFDFNAVEILLMGNSPALNAAAFHLNHVLMRKESVQLTESSGETARSVVDYITTYKLKNTVNIRRAWVTGIFANAPLQLAFPTTYVYNYGLTAGELTAIFLHETGHAFTMAEMTDRLSTTNQVLAAMMRSKVKDPIEVQEYVFKAAGKILTNDEKMFPIVEGITSEKATFTVIINALETYSHSETSTGHYDAVACEQLADQFVSRMGYARQLVVAMDKSMSNASDKYTSARHIQNLIDAALPVIKDGAVGLTGVFFGPVGMLIGGMYILAVIALVTRKSGELNRDNTYDGLRVRYMRIREDLLNRIKDKKIPPAKVKEHLNDLKEIDKYIDNLLKPETRGWLESLANLVFKKNKKALDARTLQRELEELASNDLYRVAAQLRTNK